jgi:hypothetical protein
VDDEGLGDDVLHTETRVERGKWILKDNLQVAPQGTHFTAARRQQIAAVEAHSTRRGLDQAKDEAS